MRGVRDGAGAVSREVDVAVVQRARERRSALARARDRAASADGPDDAVRDVIRASWGRSRRSVHDDLATAPLDDAGVTDAAWRTSPLQRAVAALEGDLRDVADDGYLVVAVTDPSARILWTAGGRVMRRRAEAVNFVPGGRWDEASVGTNALDLALRTGAPATVWSAEHFAPAVQGWVCWAAPVHDPQGRALGVLDLSTTWERSHPLGLSTARSLAALLAHEVAATAAAARRLAPAGTPAAARPGHLRLRLLGRAEAELDSEPLPLTRRQLELVALLALAPGGLSADALHDVLYGDAPVSRSTLKAEVSHLRTLLRGGIGSRPYRLLGTCSTDVEEVRRRLRAGDVAGAAESWGGELLAGVGGTDAPGLRRVDAELTAGLRQAVLGSTDRAAVLRYAATAGADPHVVRTRLPLS